MEMRLNMKLNNRTVIDTEIDGIDLKDYPKFCDVYFSSGTWEDTGKELSDRELEILTDEHGDELHERATLDALSE